MFVYIKDKLEGGIDLIINELDYPLDKRPILEMDTEQIIHMFRGISNQKIIINLLQVLKYLCDNCFLSF